MNAFENFITTSEPTAVDTAVQNSDAMAFFGSLTKEAAMPSSISSAVSGASKLLKTTARGGLTKRKKMSTKVEVTKARITKVKAPKVKAPKVKAPKVKAPKLSKLSSAPDDEELIKEAFLGNIVRAGAKATRPGGALAELLRGMDAAGGSLRSGVKSGSQFKDSIWGRAKSRVGRFFGDGIEKGLTGVGRSWDGRMVRDTATRRRRDYEGLLKSQSKADVRATARLRKVRTKQYSEVPGSKKNLKYKARGDLLDAQATATNTRNTASLERSKNRMEGADNRIGKQEKRWGKNDKRFRKERSQEAKFERKRRKKFITRVNRMPSVIDRNRARMTEAGFVGKGRQLKNMIKANPNSAFARGHQLSKYVDGNPLLAGMRDNPLGAAMGVHAIIKARKAAAASRTIGGRAKSGLTALGNWTGWNKAPMVTKTSSVDEPLLIEHFVTRLR